MRYFFDVAHGARIVVSHASVTNVAVFHSRDSLHQPLTKSVGATHILVKVDWGKVANVASIAAAPFTGGASLAANAGLRAGMVGVRGLQAGRAGKQAAAASKGLDAAIAAKPPAAKVAVPRSRNWRGQYAGGPAGGERGIRSMRRSVDEGLQDRLDTGLDAPNPLDQNSSFKDIQNRGKEGTPTGVDIKEDTLPTHDTEGNVTGSSTQTTLDMSDQQGTMSATHEVDAAEAHKKLMDEQHEKAKDAYDKTQDKNNPTIIATGAGAYGMNTMRNRAQTRQAEQQAEMERIEGIAQAGREKSGTGGGQVAVTA